MHVNQGNFWVTFLKYVWLIIGWRQKGNWTLTFV